MRMQKCPECRKKISKKASRCPFCGVDIGKRFSLWWFALLFLIAGGMLAYVKIAGHLEAQRLAQELIEKQRIAEQKERERQERFRMIVDGFYANQEDIIANLRTLIKNNSFEEARAELADYDIPNLQGELTPIKNELKEKELAIKVKAVPSKDSETNYKLYYQLVQLNPQKKIYQKKLNRYKPRYAEKKYRQASQYLKSSAKDYPSLRAAFEAIDEAIKLDPRQKKYRRAKYLLEKEKLLYYQGNTIAEMAVRDDGRSGNERRFYVWIKNVSSQVVSVDASYFTLIGKDNRSYRFLSSDMISVNLQPGTETEGRVSFKTRSLPQKLIFANDNIGTISRLFP